MPCVRAWELIKVEKLVRKENRNECVTVCEGRKQTGCITQQGYCMVPWFYSKLFKSLVCFKDVSAAGL